MNMMLSNTPSRRAAAVGGLISLLVGAGFVCVYLPGNLSSAVNTSADQHPGLRGARSVASDFVVDSKLKGTWLDPSSDESTHNLGAWSNNLVVPTTTEPKQAFAADVDFQQWKRERRDVAVVRRLEDARRQAPGPAPSDVFPPLPPPPNPNPNPVPTPPPNPNPNPVPTPTPQPPTTPSATAAVEATVQQLRQDIKEKLESECSSSGASSALDNAKCVFNTLSSAVDALDEAGILDVIAASNPAVAATVKDVVDGLKKFDEDCSKQGDTADGFKTCIRQKITDLEKEAKDTKQTEKSALVKIFKQFYADVNICAAKKDADAVKTCTDKRTDKFLNRLEDYVKKALPAN